MLYTIGEVSKKTGLSQYTLRYYDREGLLPDVSRGAGGTRRFSEEDLAWLGLVGCLKASGLSIKEIRRYIELSAGGDGTLELRREIIRARRAALEAQMEELRRTLEVLEYKCWYYDTAIAAGSEEAAKNAVPPEKIWAADGVALLLRKK